MPQPRTLASVLDAPDNSFNVVRLTAAALVIVSHSFALLAGGNFAQPLAWGPFNLGSCAVNVFFVLSGIMLSRSFDLRPDWRTFTAGRLLRIFPGLIVSGIATAWIVGPLFSDKNLADYFGELHAVFYPFVGFLGGHAHVDFVDSIFPDQLNSSLWTIKYELLAYMIFGAASALSLLKSRFVAASVTVILGLLLVLAVHPDPLNGSVAGNVVRFGFCFALGVTLYRFRDTVWLRPGTSILLLAGALPLGLTPAGSVAWIVAGAYAAMSLASSRVPGVTRFANRWDISFGVYLYGWPIQQVLTELGWARASILGYIALTLLIAGLVGWVSFLLVERPAMRLRDRLANLTRLHGRRAVLQSHEG